MNWATKWSNSSDPFSETTLKVINPPHLMRLVQVRARRLFYVGGRPIAVGQETEVEFHVAQSLQAAGRCELLT